MTDSRVVYETPEDIAALQDLLDRSYDRAGAHLRGITTPERRMTAEETVEALTGMRLLALATVTADGRPIVGPVDGIFFRGAFHFGSSKGSVRYRHIRERPQVSATHLPGEEMAVTVHGRAALVDFERGTEFRQALLDVYVPLYGASWETDFLDGLGEGGFYARIDAERMFTFRMRRAG